MVHQRSGGPTTGFTLVELAVVVFIMATLLAVAVPSFVRSYHASQLNHATRSLVTTCQLARLKAALSQQEVRLELDLDRQQVRLLQPNSAVRAEFAEIVHKQFALPANIRLRSVEVPELGAVTEGVVEVFFHPNGTSDPATLLLQDGAKGAALFLVLDPVTARARPYEVKQ